MNDNRKFTRQDQLVDWMCRAGKYNRLRQQHPGRKDLPDYGLLLKPEEEAQFRARAHQYGVNFEKIKEEFVWSHQVIPFSPLEESRDLMEQHAIPLNCLRHYFDLYLTVCIRSELRQRERQQK